MTTNRESIFLALIAAIWVLIGSYPLLLRAIYCPQQPLHQSCTITVRQ
jgi:hypothetical protein